VLAVIALAACEPPPVPPPPAPTSYVVPPGPLAWTHAAEIARLGRVQAPTPAFVLGIEGTGAPLRRPTVWSVPGDGPARAVVYGSLEDKAAIELVDIDAGRVVWRDTKLCTGPVVGVTATAIVCADATGVRAVAVADGALDWETEDTFLAMDGELVVIAAGADLAVRRAGGGDELAHLVLPVGFPQGMVTSACPERELFALDASKVIRLVAAPNAPAKLAWMVATSAPPDKLDPGCGGPTILATSGTTLSAIDRATGAIVGTLDGVRGWWRARDGRDRIEVATPTGVVSYDRRLADPVATTLPVLGALIAERGERRLVSAGPTTAALLDRDGMRAYLPFGEQAGALGDRALVAGSWTGEATETVHRRALPEAIDRGIIPPPQFPGTAVPAELRDLPPLGALGEELAATEPRGPTFVSIDPHDPGGVIVKIVDGDAVTTWRADLRARAWRDVTAECVACVTRSGATRTLRGPGWSASGAGDYVEVGRDVAIWFADDRARVIALRDGAVLGELASDDGTRPAIAIVERGLETWLVAAEHGAIVARLPLAGMLPVWSIGVDGAVEGIASAGDGVVVTLAEGDAYRIALLGPQIHAIAGLGLRFRVDPDLVAGSTLGGPLYGPRPPPPPVPRLPRAPVPKQPPPIDGPFTPPSIATPMPLPPIVGQAFHLTLFDLAGSVRARNEYALRDATLVGVRSAGAPLVVAHAEGALVLDAHTGDPLAQVPLLDGARVFSTVVDGKPFVGAVVGAPLRIVAIPVAAR